MHWCSFFQTIWHDWLYWFYGVWRSFQRYFSFIAKTSAFIYTFVEFISPLLRTNILSKPLAAFPHNPRRKEWSEVRGEWISLKWRLSIFGKDIGRARGSNQRPPLLKSSKLPTELRELGRAFFVCLFPFIYRRYRLPIWATFPEDG